MCRSVRTALLSASVVFGCAAAQPAPPPGKTELRTDILVRDRHSRPLRDLRPEELEITDGGAPAGIASLRLATGAVSVVSFVFDDLNAAAIRLVQPVAKRMAAEFAGSGAYYSVWRITDRLGLVQPFTRDSSGLGRAIEAAGSISPAAPPSSGPPPAEGSAEGLDSMEAQLAANARLTIERWQRIAGDEPSRASISGLLALARQQGSLKGRKVVVYFSDALAIAEAGAEQLQNVIGSANRSGVSFYAVDAAGLAEAAKPAASGSASPERGRLVFIQLNTGVRSVSPLRRLSEDTGGLYLGRARDVQSIVRRIGEDITSYYELAYSRPTDGYDGQFRAVAVNLKRVQTRVQARAGYFSLPPDSAIELAPFEVPLIRALETGGKADSIPFRVELLRFGPAEGKVRAALAIEVPLNGIECRADNESEDCRARFSILAVVKTPDGNILRKFSQDISQPMAADSQGVHALQRHFAIEPGEYRGEAIIVDRQTGKLSRQAFPVSLPAAPGLAMSDVSLVRRLDSVPAGADAEDPLTYQGLLVVPQLSREWDRPDREPGAFLTLYPDPGASAKPKLKLELKQGERTVSKPSAKLPESAVGAPIRLVVPLGKGLAPGKYQLLATASQGKTAIERSLPFEVRERPADLGATGSADEAASRDDGALSFDEPEPALLATAAKPLDEEVKRILDRARERAAEYRSALPNFLCTRVSTALMKKRGRTHWSFATSKTEWLQYLDGNETTETVTWGRVDAPGDLKKLRLNGEFGATHNAVLADKAAAVIEWAGLAQLRGDRVHVFDYRVDRKYSSYMLSLDAGSRILTGYHGRIYVDADGTGVRRISVEADGIPPDFPIQESILSVDYDYVQIAGQRTLLPQRAVLKIRRGGRILKLDRAFRNYRKFSGASDIKYSEEIGPNKNLPPKRR